MKYRNAAELVPAQLLQELQRYASGATLYVPAAHRKPWGEGTGAKELYTRRNAEIRARFSHGTGMGELSESYCLSEDAVHKIIYQTYQKGETKMNEQIDKTGIDYSGYFWQNELVRLVSARPEPPDEESYATLFNSQQRFMNEGELELPWDEKKSREGYEKFVNTYQDGSSRVIFDILSLDGKCVGSCNIHGVDERNGTFGIFSHVMPAYEGKGYETAAGRLMLDYAFNERRLHTCCVWAYDGDPLGNVLYGGLGFHKDGVLRARAYHQGRYWDENHYSLLAEEFSASK